ncbi:MAG: hypothetical protein PHR53_00470 [Bacteroidales bacterium]|nr:hypothetical protein [Bacteroidales bacterium]
MKKIDGQTVVLEKNAEKIFNTLSDFRNFEHFIPEKVENWLIEGNTCSFTISGIGTISVKVTALQESHTITYSSLQSPVNFELRFLLTPIKETQTEVDISVYSDANPMVLMMLKHPIRNFMQMIADKASEVSDKFIL